MSLYWKIERNCSYYLYSKIKNTKEIPVVFHIGSTYDYHFIIRERGTECEGQFKCLGENTGVYPYEFMDSWKRLDETALPNKEAFYSELYLEDVTDEDYIHAQKVFGKRKKLGEYDDIYAQSETLLLADVFRNFRSKCIEIYEIDPAHFLSSPELTWQACLKKNRSKIKIVNRY